MPVVHLPHRWRTSTRPRLPASQVFLAWSSMPFPVSRPGNTGSHDPRSETGRAGALGRPDAEGRPQCRAGPLHRRPRPGWSGCRLGTRARRDGPPGVRRHGAPCRATGGLREGRTPGVLGRARPPGPRWFCWSWATSGAAPWTTVAAAPLHCGVCTGHATPRDRVCLVPSSLRAGPRVPVCWRHFVDRRSTS